MSTGTATDGVTRRTVLAAGAGLTATATLAGAVGVHLAHPRLPLDGTLLAGMVGQTFVDTQTGARLVLTSVTGLLGATVTAERFSLLFVADDVAPPSAIRTLRHADGDLVVHVGPVLDERTLEAVVDRTGVAG